MRFKFILLSSVGLVIALNGCFSTSHTQSDANIKNQQRFPQLPSGTVSPPSKSKLREKCSEARTVTPIQKFKLRRCSNLEQFKDVFILEKDNKEIRKWDASISASFSLGFDAFEADLDGDGRQELIVASHNNTSNGLGVSYWTVYIFDDTLFYPFQTPMHFSTQDYGKLGTFVSNSDRFEVWTAAWEWTGTDNTLGIIGQQWQYQGGELIPTDHPVLKRWYSYNFQSERSKTYNDPHRPYLWLSNSKVQAYEENPLLQSYEIISIENRTIQNISQKCIDKFNCPVTVDFNPSQGNPQSYVYAEYQTRYLPKESEENKRYFSYFGDWSSRRIYPIGYLPSDPNKWLKDRQCKVITYGGKYSKKFKILWIM